MNETTIVVDGPQTAATPTVKRGIGRPRTVFTKKVTFVMRDGAFVPRVRGRARKDDVFEVREVAV